MKPPVPEAELISPAAHFLPTVNTVFKYFCLCYVFFLPHPLPHSALDSESEITGHEVCVPSFIPNIEMFEKYFFAGEEAGGE